MNFATCSLGGKWENVSALVFDRIARQCGIESGWKIVETDNYKRIRGAILKAQRRSVAVYSFYSSGTLTEGGNSSLILNAQGSLNRISEETGGRAYFTGTISPINFQPFFRDLNLALNRQFALTYLSTHMKKGYHKIQVSSTNPEVKIEYPKSYYYRGNK